MSNIPEYNLPSDAYANFDALSLKSFIIKQLNESGKFTDQNYEGSNISALLDILAYYTHVLLFYLNQTSSETMFSQASIYENMNRIVKLIGYNPTGRQTSITPINCVASAALPVGSYYLPKYSYFLIDNIQYTFNDAYFFEKVTSTSEVINSLNDNAILYQGTVGEYPIYTAEGLQYESFPIVVDNLVDNNDSKFISHGSISVYIKEIDTGFWQEYTEVDSLFLTNPTSRVFENRLNENGHYEIKFGNDIFGKKLISGDQVAVFYILSDGERGIISKNAINANKLFFYNSSTFNQITNDLDAEIISTPIGQNNRSFLNFNNSSISTIIQNAETVDQIRQNASTFLSTQIRLVTESDYEKFLKKAIPNILNDVKVVDNNTFINEYIQYFYDICVDPNKVNRVILNQVNFADSCDFNNINIFCVPSINVEEEGYPEFLSNSFKNLIKSTTQDKKIITNEVVPRDPIYLALDLGFTNKTPSKSIYKDTQLIIYREKNDKTNKSTLKSRVVDILLSYFNPTNIKLGQTINMSELTSSILSLPGVRNIKTVNNAENIFFEGLSFISWNPMFEGVDESLINQTVTLPYFKYPYIFRPRSIITRIEVLDYNE
jgi:hypothetical protein